MKIQTSTDYAVRILQFLHANQGEVYPAAVISQAIGVSYPFFTRIANQLKREGLLKATHGRNGGYELGRSGHEISVYDAFLVMEGNLCLTVCLQKEKPCKNAAQHNCLIHKFFGELQERVIAAMSGMAIADLARAEDRLQAETEQIA